MTKCIFLIQKHKIRVCINDLGFYSIIYLNFLTRDAQILDPHKYECTQIVRYVIGCKLF